MTFICVTAVLLILFNVISWCIFLQKFKKLFSTKQIISDTEEAINQFIRDVNYNVSRNKDLLDAQMKQMKEVTAEAERRLGTLRNELNLAQQSLILQQKIDRVSQSAPLEKLDKKSSPKRSGNGTISGKYSKNIASVPEPEPIVTEEKEELVLPFDIQEISAIHKIPLVEPEVYLSDTPVVPQKSFNTRVKELHDLGHTDESIAIQLGRSIQEVKLALQLA